MSDDEKTPAEQSDVEQSDVEATQPHPYQPGYGVTGKFAQDGNDDDPMVSAPAGEADALEAAQPAGPSTDVPASEADQLAPAAEPKPDTTA